MRARCRHSLKVRSVSAGNSRVIVRPYGDDGVRVTVAAPHENDAFLAFAQRWAEERV